MVIILYACKKNPIKYGVKKTNKNDTLRSLVNLYCLQKQKVF